MSFSMHSFRNRTRPEGLSLAALLAVLLTAAMTAAALVAAPVQRPDYFTELEISAIREAQEIDHRTEVLLEIAGRRLGALGLVEGDSEDDSDEPGLGSRVGRVLITILNPQAAAEIAAENDQRAGLGNDLSSHSRADLLRGYYQALEETMDNIDDAYERDRGDVTGSVEDLRDFTRDSLALLRALETSEEEPLTDDEADALDDAIEQTELALDGARSALEMLSQ